jgi:hypothetical protein
MPAQISARGGSPPQGIGGHAPFAPEAHQPQAEAENKLLFSRIFGINALSN